MRPKGINHSFSAAFKYKGRVPLKQLGVHIFARFCMAYMILLGSHFTCSRRAFSRAGQRHSKAASTADTVGTALQSHSVGVGLAICFDAGACDRRKSGGVQRAGRSAIQDWQ